jgi:drug/metabolite transporter (DMT)-like permease
MISTTSSRGKGIALALFSAATFSTSGSFARSLLDAGWSPGAAVAARVTVAALILLGPTLWSLRGRAAVVRRNAGLLLGYGVIAVAGAQLFFFNAVNHIPVGVALLLEYLGTILVVVWMWLRHGQRPRPLTSFGSVLSLAGLVFVLNPSTGGFGLDPVGVLWGLGAAVGLASFFVLSARSSDGLPPLALAGLGLTIAAVTLLVAGVSGVFPMTASFGAVNLAGQQVSWIVPVLGLSVVAAAVAYLAGIAAARALGPKLSSFVGLTEVLFAVFFAWLFLGEAPTAAQMAGGALIVGGVVLVHVDELRGGRHGDDRPHSSTREPGETDTERWAA